MDKPTNDMQARVPGTRSIDKAGTQVLDLTALQQTPGFMIRILQLEIFDRFYRFFEPMNLSPVDYAILLIVRDNKTVTQSALAAVLKMQLPNLVKILTKMEQEGILKRKRSNRDRRAVELGLTAAGRKRADEASRLDQAFNKETLAALSKQERVIFLQLLTRLVEAHIKLREP
jgi:DNA-binding MarR family transcriptional regulator